MYACIPGTHAAGFSTVTVRGGNKTLSQQTEGGREWRTSKKGRRRCCKRGVMESKPKIKRRDRAALYCDGLLLNTNFFYKVLNLAP